MTSHYARSVDQFCGVGKNAAGETAALFRVSADMQAHCATAEQMARPSMTLRELDTALTKQAVGAGLAGERGKAQAEQYDLAMRALRP